MNSLAATGLCVKCGLCLPHCPTFQLTGIETESPRGRITLMQALQSGGSLPDGAETHLMNCLQCRACEAMCPSRVPFGRLMDTARASIVAGRAHDVDRLISNLFGKRSAIFATFARMYRKTGLQSWIRRAGLLRGRWRRLDRMLCRDPRIFKWRGIGTGASQANTVQLVPGCVSSVLDSETLDAAVLLLETAGYRVEIPTAVHCCGALQQHGGQVAEACREAQRNFGALGCEIGSAVTTVVSGCTAHLKEYPVLYPNEIPTQFGDRVRDIHQLLLDSPDPGRLQFVPAKQPVVLHLPCTQRNVLKETRAIVDLLRRVPDINLSVLSPAVNCCGGAGDYCITHPNQADRLLALTLEPLAHGQPALLLTSNIGCALHLTAGIEARAWPVEVLHPLTFLARLLRDAPGNLR